MRKDLLTIGLVIVGITAIYYLGKNRFTWKDLSQKPEKLPKPEFEEVDVPMTISADASTSSTIPVWANSIFRRTWIVK